MATARTQPAGNGIAVWLTAAAAVGLVAFLVAWLLGWFRFTTDPRVREILALQETARQQFVESGGPATLTEAAAAVAAYGQIREKVESLPEPLRREVEEGGGNVMRGVFRARTAAYFSLPPEKRQAELDRQIKQEELMRQAFAAAGVAWGPFGAGREGGGPAGVAPGGAGGGAAANPAPPTQGGGPPGRTEEDRNAWRKRMIDRTSPEERARYVEYRNAMEKRREQLGLPPRGPR